MSKLTALTRPIVQFSRDVALAVGFLTAAFVGFIVAQALLSAVVGDVGSGFVAIWWIGAIVAYRFCHHNVF